MKIDLNTSRAFAAILRDAGHAYVAFPFVLMSIPLVALPLTVLPWIAPITDSRTNRVILFLASNMLTPLIAGARVIAANEALRDTRPDPLRCFEAAGRRYAALFTTFLLSSLLMIASLIAFPYFLVRWQFDDTAVMLEKKRNWSALDRSAALVRGRWWRVFGISTSLLLWAFIAEIALVILNLTGHSEVWMRPAIAIVGIVISPYVSIAHLLLYYDLRTRTGEAVPSAAVTV